MENQEINVFIHASGRQPEAVAAAAEETLADVLRRLNLLPAGDEGHHIFVGEAVTELIEVDEGADHAIVDINLKLEALDLHKHRHVHLHKCKRIAVLVHFSADTEEHKFKPNTTIGVVTDWARKQFPIDPPLAHEYVLEITGTNTQPRSTEHLGDVVKGDTCSISFDLVKEMTPKG
jgi:hypothetical protein